MEDGVNGPLSLAEVNDHVNNGVVSSSMANFPEGTVAETKEDKNGSDTTRVNGDNFDAENNSCSNESDALVIDESGPKQRKFKKKRRSHKLKLPTEATSNSEVIPHSNPFFNESLFELSLQHQNSNDDNSLDNVKAKTKRAKGKPKPKLKEYAQYLGLQPTVQFKCSKCGQAGFDSLHTLQEHLIQCNSVQNIGDKSPNSENHCSGFKLTRRVFLCSACGTYYENWNLYMHMLEFHRRYICLYCLGMFSMLDDLCQHIQLRHNLEPGRKNSLDEFFSAYSEPCYVVCCECNKLFSEQDNFFYHNCAGNKKKAKPIKQQILPENHVTGDSVAEMLTEPEKTIEESIERQEKNPESKDIQEGVVQMNKEEIAMETEEQIECLTENDKKVESEEVSQICTSEKIKDKEEHQKEVEENISVETTNEMEHSEETLSDKECENSTESCLENSLEDDGILENENETIEEVQEEYTEPVETRKVPKLSLKLPKSFSLTEPDEESDDSEKPNLEVDQIESENEQEPEVETDQIENEGFVDEPMEHDNFEIDRAKDGSDENVESENALEPSVEPLLSQMQVADKDIPIIEIELDQPLDKIDVRVLLQKCLKATAASCIYCNHARKIAVNGKQLGLHSIAEHRYSSVVKSITAEELIPESFNTRIKECLEDLNHAFFNLDSSASDEAVTFSHLFECFQCYYSTTVHKELYLHNRKFHSKNLLLCIMCKSNFYSYSELICHLCPGIYILDYDLQFRCCMCVSDDLPSAFRLMVHLRKRHNVCDVCLEMCHNQYRLSNHVWKHKLHHFCYRCGIAYRNKPDITRHLFWKHGTESVLCKKCLQKKWPHVYHFCVPPTSFTCEECGLILTRAVSLKVHKRIHTDDKRHECTFEDCTEKFISKKLMLKHDKRHREPLEEMKPEIKEETLLPIESTVQSEEIKEELPKPKPKIDVYDLPELNLSESDSSDSETEISRKPKDQPAEIISEEIQAILEEKNEEQVEEDKTIENENDVSDTLTKEDEENSNALIQNIWDNFKNYQASKEKLDHMFAEPEKIAEPIIDIPIPVVEEQLTAETALRDHDYCAPEQKTDTSIIEVKPALTLTERVDHDYCFHKEEGVTAEKPPLEENKIEEKDNKKKKYSSSSSSSGSDTSCTCGSNCSCSSSSGSSSSSSDSSDSDSSTEEGRQRQQVRRQRRREKNKEENKKIEIKKEPKVKPTDKPIAPTEIVINESDLETTESETDEEFYDREPHKIARKLLDENRAKIVAELGPNNVPNGSFIESTSRPPTPPAGSLEETLKPKKKKLKKRKKKKDKKEAEIRQYDTATNVTSNIPPYYQQFRHQQQPVLPPITLSLKNPNSPKHSGVRAPGTPPVSTAYPKLSGEFKLTRQDSTDSSLRASKRRRVPNKFYGYSSDEEEKQKTGPPSHKWRKVEVTQAAPRSPLTVPPITIKTGIPQSPHPTVEPISIRLPPTSHPSDFKVKQRSKIPPIRLLSPKLPARVEPESETDTNESDVEIPQVTPPVVPKPNQPQLYCYCRCPYDEVSEMIGCDSSECEIEWFHFECVGIMVPPKGQWFCPDCRKKKQQRAMLTT